MRLTKPDELPEFLRDLPLPPFSQRWRPEKERVHERAGVDREREREQWRAGRNKAG